MIIFSVFILGFMDVLFNEDEEVEKEYSEVKHIISNNEQLLSRYGEVQSFSANPSYKQYPDSSIYYTAVEYQSGKEVYIECKIFKSENKITNNQIKEYVGNWPSIQNKIENLF